MLLIFFVVIGVIAYFVWDYFHHKELLPAKDRCIFVTGCDSGFGRALTKRLAQIGCYVFAGCYTDQGMDELKRETSHVIPVRLDVGDTSSIQKAYDDVIHGLKGRTLWGVVNNAGIGGIGGPIEFLSRKDLLDTFNINCIGMAEVGRIFLPLLKESHGRLVNCVSMAGRVGFLDMGHYVASKFAMEGLSDVQRRELSLWGVHVSILNPGLFRTGLMNVESYTKAKLEQWAAVDQTVRDEYGEEFLKCSMDTTVKMLCTRAKTDTSSVLDAYTHALFAEHPRARYICGKDAWVLCTLALLPGFVLDKVLLLRGRLMPKKLQQN